MTRCVPVVCVVGSFLHVDGVAGAQNAAESDQAAIVRDRSRYAGTWQCGDGAVLVTFEKQAEGVSGP